MPLKRPSPPRTLPSPPAKRARLPSPLEENPLRFRREPSGTIQISTWNVAGLATCNSKKWDYGFRKYVEAEDATVLCLTEVNEKDPEPLFEHDPNFEFLRARYPYRYWASKVAVLSKIAPIAPAVYGYPDGTRYEQADGRARICTLEFKECYLVTTYVPNSGAEFKRLDRRQDWAADFEPHIRSLDAKKPVIWCGDFNVIRTTTPTSNLTNDLQYTQLLGKAAGTHPIERELHERLVGDDQPMLMNPRRPGPKFVDVWRLIKGKDWKQYTYYGKKMGGWRLDGFIVSERFLYRIRKCEIRQEVRNQFFAPKASIGRGALSDHWPVMLSLEMEEL
ncbi:hypothetical protein JCM8097_003227 [Rhodosporidiobolus ruineniae]